MHEILPVALFDVESRISPNIVFHGVVEHPIPAETSRRIPATRPCINGAGQQVEEMPDAIGLAAMVRSVNGSRQESRIVNPPSGQL